MNEIKLELYVVETLKLDYNTALEVDDASTEMFTSVLGLNTSGVPPDKLLEDEWLLIVPIGRGGPAFGVGSA